MWRADFQPTPWTWRLEEPYNHTHTHAGRHAATQLRSYAATQLRSYAASRHGGTQARTDTHRHAQTHTQTRTDTQRNNSWRTSVSPRQIVHNSAHLVQETATPAPRSRWSSLAPRRKVTPTLRWTPSLDQHIQAIPSLTEIQALAQAAGNNQSNQPDRTRQQGDDTDDHKPTQLLDSWQKSRSPTPATIAPPTSAAQKHSIAGTPTTTCASLPPAAHARQPPLDRTEGHPGEGPCRPSTRPTVVSSWTPFRSAQPDLAHD